MKSQNYLIFSLSNIDYGIPAAVIQELFFLPELMPVFEAPPYIIGMVNLRGLFVPVMNLAQRLGHDPRPPQVSDSVIVLNLAEQRLGILVNHLDEVKSIAPEQIQSVFGVDNQTNDHQNSCRAGIAKINDAVVALLNPEPLFQSASANLPADISQGFQGKDWNSHFSPQERQVLQERAKNLRQLPQTDETSTRRAIAVFGLRGEYFGIPLETVSEFTNVHKVTPIPCCPAHILGNMNLRGEILTLVDIGDSIHLPKKGSQSPQNVVIVRLNEIVAGIVVDQIFDVVHIHPTDVKSVPTTIRSASGDYLQGVVAYQHNVMSLINLPRLFSAGEFIVDESF